MMTRHFMLAAGTVALFAPLLAAPASGQNDRRTPPAVAGRDLMMRAGPQASYPQVRRIQQGQQVQIYGCLNDRSWCDVGYGNDRGWVNGPDLYADYGGRRDSIVNLGGSLQIGNLTFSIGNYWDNHYRQQPFYGERRRWEQRYLDDYQPSWGQRPNQAYWGDGTTNGVMLRRAYLRAGPDAAYPRVGIIRARTRVTIHGCLRDWSWCDISNRRNRGWVFGQHVGSNYRGQQRSVASIAPYIGITVLNFSFGRYWDDNYRSQPFYRERDSWERQYVQRYRPSWGAGPERRYENRQWVPQRQPPRQQQQLQRQQVQVEQQSRALAQGRAEARAEQQAQSQARARAQRNPPPGSARKQPDARDPSDDRDRKPKPNGT